MFKFKATPLRVINTIYWRQIADNLGILSTEDKNISDIFRSYKFEEISEKKVSNKSNKNENTK